MSRRHLGYLLQFVAVAALLLSAAATRSRLLAGPSLQDVPRLDGVRLYFSEANKEASPFDRSGDGLSRLAGLLTSLGAEIEVLDWRRDIPTDADLVVIAGPTKDLGDDQSARLWAYLKEGGALLVLAEPLVTTTVEGGSILVEANKALQAERGLFLLTWADYGIRARDDVVVAPSDGGELALDVIAGGARADHPVTAGLAGDLAFFGARSVGFDASIQAFTATPLVFGGGALYGETAYIAYIEIGEAAYTVNQDTAPESLALAVASEDSLSGSRVLVIGDRDFATNAGGLRTSPPNTAAFVYPANVEFLLRAVAWLAGADETATVPLSFSTPAPTPATGAE
ncbi:MAG: hypothetical protein AB1435_02590 [Chloroflexota bacterium]